MDLPQDMDKPVAIYCFAQKQNIAFIKPPSKQVEKKYSELPGSDPIDQKKIAELFTKLGTLNYWNLMKEQSRLKQIGKEIEHVHPLKLLGFIFSYHPNMKIYMKEVLTDMFKRSNFLGGFIPSMEHQLLKNNVYKYLNDFSNEVKVPLEYIKPYFDKKDWEGLIWLLIKN